MRAPAIVAVAACAIPLTARSASAREPAPADTIVAIYEFDKVPDGRAFHVRFAGTVRLAGFEDPRNVRSDALTSSEQAGGARIIARRRYSREAGKQGAKRRDGILFDVRTRKFVTKKA